MYGIEMSNEQFEELISDFTILNASSPVERKLATKRPGS
jgi:hypothetical protein